SRLESQSENRNLKNIAGGIYDIDFIVGARILRGRDVEMRGNLREAITLLAQQDLLPSEDAAALSKAAELFLTIEHCLRLVLGRSRKWLPAHPPQREAVQRLAQGMLPRLSSGDL